MNIFENDYELSTDKFQGLIFGNQSQLFVIGHYQVGYVKTYIVKCAICSLDPILFGSALFRTSLNHLRLGKYPCGCSKVPKWNEDQWITKCKRLALEMGYKFEYNPMNLKFSGQTTPCVLTCSIHGPRTIPLSSVIDKRSCKACSDASGRAFKDDSLMIDSFIQSNLYCEGTVFYRSDRRTTQNARNYWWIECPICGSKGEISTNDIRRGNQPCECARNPKQAYINLVSDGGFPIALKFGITKNYKTRVKDQHRKSIYDIRLLTVWEFTSKNSCKAAETECKRTVECGILSATEMRDGWSETTYLNNFDIISKIYEDFGGIEIQLNHYQCTSIPSLNAGVNMEVYVNVV